MDGQFKYRDQISSKAAEAALRRQILTLVVLDATRSEDENGIAMCR